jgi:hypothetical protein
MLPVHFAFEFLCVTFDAPTYSFVRDMQLQHLGRLPAPLEATRARVFGWLRRVWLATARGALRARLGGNDDLVQAVMRTVRAAERHPL